MKTEGQGVAPQAIAQDRESLRDFISIAAHDLREPLRAIRVGTRLLVSNNPASAEESNTRGEHYILDGVDRLEILIRDIAEYCYHEVDEFKDRSADLDDVLMDAQRELAVALKENGATITHDPLPTVLGDGTSLAAVFRALILNSCKFRSEVAPSIHISAAREGSEWIVSVRDNGAGFDPNYRERIFRPFERLNGKQYPGSGLGLSLARRIIKQHGGRIWAESCPGDGSTFYFSLPILG